MEIKQIMGKIMVKEPDKNSYFQGGHHPFLIEGDEIVEVVEPAEEQS